MKLLIVALTLVATTLAQGLSSDYLPPVEEYTGASSNAVVETNFLDNEPSHTLTDDGYRYKTVKRYRLRQRRDVNELLNSYLPPFAASAQAPVYSAPVETYEVEASEPAPAHSYGDDGYRYRAVKRNRLRRRRRDVSELSNNYLPPFAASAQAPVYSAPFETYEVEASEPAPAHSYGDDGYRYRAVKRNRLRRRRRDVSELSNNYLPPFAASAQAPVYSAPVETYEVEASEPAPAHSYGDDGYRYRAVKRNRLRRRRRDVSELSNNYLPPFAASAQAPVYSAPVETYAVEASEPAPAHSYGDDGYRYRAVKRNRLRRHRRDVSELSNNFLPPFAASAEAPVFHLRF